MKNDEGKTLLAKNLIRLRKQMGITQASISNAIGIERSRYAHYENKTMPSALVLRKLAIVLNVSIDQLLCTPEQFLKMGEGKTANFLGSYDFNQLKTEEKELILKFRLLTADNKTDVNKYVDTKLEKLEME